MCDDTPYTLLHNDCPFNSQECIVLVTTAALLLFTNLTMSFSWYHFSMDNKVTQMNTAAEKMKAFIDIDKKMTTDMRNQSRS